MYETCCLTELFKQVMDLKFGVDGESCVGVS